MGQALIQRSAIPPERIIARFPNLSFGECKFGKAVMWGHVCLQLSFEEGLTSNGCFTLTLQLKNERDVCLYRPGVGMVILHASWCDCVECLSFAQDTGCYLCACMQTRSLLFASNHAMLRVTSSAHP